MKHLHHSRDLNQIWHGDSPHARESCRLCGGRGKWAWVGVEILTLATAKGIWTKFAMEVPHSPEKFIGYVVGVEGGRGRGVSGRGNTDPGNR